MSNVCSIEPGWEVLPSAAADAPVQLIAPRAQAVWVDLEKLVPPDPEIRGQAVVGGLDLSGRTQGVLTGWRRSCRGDWVGVVDFHVHYANGGTESVFWRQQLVPAYALSPCEDPDAL